MTWADLTAQERLVWACAFALAARERRRGGDFCGPGVAARHARAEADGAVELLREGAENPPVASASLSTNGTDAALQSAAE
jgi:hypothetical protein